MLDLYRKGPRNGRCYTVFIIIIIIIAVITIFGSRNWKACFLLLGEATVSAKLGVGIFAILKHKEARSHVFILGMNPGLQTLLKGFMELI